MSKPKGGDVVHDEEWMKRNGRVREFSDATTRYIVAGLFAAAAPALHYYFAAGTLAKAAVPALSAGLSVTFATMGVKGS